jgi:mycothiol synthase
MVHPLPDSLPAHPLPEGLEVRRVREEDVLAIWRAAEEALRDHWGAREWRDEELARWRESPAYAPALWQIAWDRGEVAGMVLNQPDEGENARYNRRRGYSEGVCVRRPWRRRGLAKALLSRSLAMWKEQGVSEVALIVDTQNEAGALELYLGLGYRPTKTGMIYRKPLAGGEGASGHTESARPPLTPASIA